MYTYAPQAAPQPTYYRGPAPAPGIAVTGLVFSIIIFGLAVLASPFTILLSLGMGASAADGYNNYSDGEVLAIAIMAFFPLGLSGLLGLVCSTVPHLSMGSPEFSGSGVKTAATVFLFLHLAFVGVGILFSLGTLLTLA